MIGRCLPNLMDMACLLQTSQLGHKLTFGSVKSFFNIKGKVRLQYINPCLSLTSSHDLITKYNINLMMICDLLKIRYFIGCPKHFMLKCQKARNYLISSPLVHESLNCMEYQKQNTASTNYFQIHFIIIFQV